MSYYYAYPVPDAFADRSVKLAAARYERKLGEFSLPYEAVRTSADPPAMDFDALRNDQWESAGCPSRTRFVDVSTITGTLPEKSVLIS